MSFSLANYRTPGARLVENADALEMFRKTKRMSFELGSLWPDLEGKTLIDSTALGFNTPGILGDQQVSGIVPLARRRLTIRDLLRAKQITAAQASWIKENAFTNAASPQTEGSAKSESADTFTIDSDKAHTLAHWLPITRQALDDLPALREFIDSVLMYGLKLKEETEILTGDGTGDHLNGLTTAAATYAGTYNAASDTRLDKLRHAALELEDGDEVCNFFVINPVDYHHIELIKDETNGVNTGKYVVGDPLGGALQVPTLWRRPVVVTNSIAAGTFLAGDASKAIICDRMNATIDLSEEHSTFFTENKIALRCEERLTLAVLRTTAFVYGSF